MRARSPRCSLGGVSPKCRCVLPFLSGLLFRLLYPKSLPLFWEKYFKMCQNVSKCTKNVSKCVKMYQNVTKNVSKCTKKTFGSFLPFYSLSALFYRLRKVAAARSEKGCRRALCKTNEAKHEGHAQHRVRGN